MDAKKKEELKENYNADSIVTLAGLEAVRERPGMYLGHSTQSVNGKMSGAQLQMAQEILSNSIDEAQDGFGDKIIITIHPDNAMTVQDFGRGLPKGKNFEAAIRQLTVLHTSGKIKSKSYVNSGGMNGVGIKGTNALSNYVDVRVVTSQHEHYHLRVQQEKILVKEDLPYDNSMPTGTIITFHPDDTYFETIEWNDDELQQRIEQSAYLVPKVHFIFVDERKPYQGDDGAHEHYYADYYKEHGLLDYVQHLTESSELIAGMNQPIPFHGQYKPRSHKDEVIEVDGALMYTTAVEPEMHTFVNSIPTMPDGPHVAGAKQGIFRVFKDYAQNHQMLKGKETIKSADTQNGLVMALSLKVPEDLLMFGDQAKTKFTTTQAKPAVQHVIEDEVSLWLADHPEIAKSVVNAIKDARQVREATRRMRKATQEARKTKKGNGKLFVSSKLKPASAKDPKYKEIYIVEGDSAAGGLLKGRNPKQQGIFPIRGKILNVEKNTKLTKALKNEEISTIASVLGAGIGKEFDPDELEYDKIIIASDADADGYAIRALLITLFYRLFPGLIEGGHLYYVNAPLFKITHYEGSEQVNDFAYNAEERDQMVEKSKKYKPQVSRFKGLGEMSTEETKRTLLDPKKRYLTRVVLGNPEEAEAALDLMMGKDTEGRKDYMENKVDYDAEDVG